jgi:HPt (histidine-containing phosphotransfer) domain-containing protein
MNSLTVAPPSTSLDSETLARLRSLAQDVDPALFTEILSTFRDDLAKYLVEVQQAIAVEDMAALRRHAHAIKGASMNTGALKLGGISACLESAAEEGGPNQISSLLAQLEREIHRVNADIGLELSAAA